MQSSCIKRIRCLKFTVVYSDVSNEITTEHKAVSLAHLEESFMTQSKVEDKVSCLMVALNTTALVRVSSKGYPAVPPFAQILKDSELGVYQNEAICIQRPCMSRRKHLPSSVWHAVIALQIMESGRHAAECGMALWDQVFKLKFRYSFSYRQRGPPRLCCQSLLCPFKVEWDNLLFFLHLLHSARILLPTDYIKSSWNSITERHHSLDVGLKW